MKTPSIKWITDRKEQLAAQLADLEAAERVMADFLGSAHTQPAAPAPAPKQTRGRPPKEAKAPPKSPNANGEGASLAERVLALAAGRTQGEIAQALLPARGNHVGIAISRHKRAGRIEEREGKLYVIESAPSTPTPRRKRATTEASTAAQPTA